jgi:hypothetical protein
MKALSICCVFCTFVIPSHSILDLLQSYSSKQKLAGFMGYTHIYACRIFLVVLT